MLLTPPGVDAGALRAGLERAYREIAATSARDLPGRVLVIAARDGPQAERLDRAARARRRRAGRTSPCDYRPAAALAVSACWPSG